MSDKLIRDMELTQHMIDMLIQNPFPPETPKDHMFKESDLQGDFTPTPRDEALRVKIEEHYKATDIGIQIKDVHKQYQSLKGWANDHGYTKQELNNARVNYQMRRGTK